VLLLMLLLTLNTHGHLIDHRGTIWCKAIRCTGVPKCDIAKFTTL
jgi:hypothetical protein